jgi:hypothetical protein
MSNGEKEIRRTRWHSRGYFKVLGGNMIPYLARLLDIAMNNNTTLLRSTFKALHVHHKGVPRQKLPTIRVKWILNNIATFTTPTGCPIHNIPFNIKVLIYVS